MLDRAVSGSLNDFFRFSTTEQKWEQLNATRVSGSPPSARRGHGMVSVGSDLYVFGGSASGGEEGLSNDGHCLGAWQIERLEDAPRTSPVLVATPFARTGCHAVPHQGLVTQDGTSPLSWHRVSHSGGADELDEHLCVHVGSCRFR